MGKATAARLRALPASRLEVLLKACNDSCLALAKQEGVTQKTLALILRAKGVTWTPWAHRPLLDGMSRAAMLRLYIECARNRTRMAKRLGVNVWTLRRRLTELGFKPRKRGDNSGAGQRVDVYVTREVMHDLYVVRGLSLRQVGAAIGGGRDAAARFLRSYDIPRRSCRAPRVPLSATELAAIRQRLTSEHVDGIMAHLADTSPHLRHDCDED